METQTETVIGTDADWQKIGHLSESVLKRQDVQPIKLNVVKKSLNELLEQYHDAREAAQTYAATVNAIAEKAGVMASVVKKLVKARAGDKFDKAKQEVEQLSLVFEEIGE